MFRQRRNVLKTLAAVTVNGMAGGAFPLTAWAQKKTAEKIEAPVIAAASDLRFPMEDILRNFESETQRKIQVTFGPSYSFCQQILEGAPFEMFLSADESFVLQLAEAKKTEDRGEVYAIGRLALYTPPGSPLKADNFLSDIRTAVRDGRLQRFAIADPEHASYGRLAEQVLRRKLIWDDIQPLLLIGEDVAQTAQFAIDSMIQGGLVAYAQAGRLMTLRGGKCVLVSETLYEPLKQRMALLGEPSDTTRLFYQYMQSKRAQNTLKRYGFLIPGT